MASIIPFMRRRGDFDDEATRRMGEAFDAACRSAREQPQIVQEIIARRIIEAAMKGERDPIRLCNIALVGLGIREEAS
jgi:hypothetical protein